MKRLVLLVEGDGDLKAMPALVAKVMQRLPPELLPALHLDDTPMKVGGIESNSGLKRETFLRHIANAIKTRSNLGAVLAVFDGDAGKFEGGQFCHVTAALSMASRVKALRTGRGFSAAVVFIRQEYESLLIASAGQLSQLKAGVAIPPDVEVAPRGAKEWLEKNLRDGYTPVLHQLELTHEIRDWTAARQLRSFQRLENAVRQLAEAVHTGQHVATPYEPTAEAPAVT